MKKGARDMNNKLETITNLFNGKEIRSIWNAKLEDYYFSKGVV